jgi:hypothetical protein
MSGDWTDGESREDSFGIFFTEYCKINHPALHNLNEDELKQLLDNITEFSRREGYITVKQINVDGCFIQLTEKGRQFVLSKRSGVEE